VTAEADVFGEKHLSHATGAERPDNAVGTVGLSHLEQRRCRLARWRRLDLIRCRHTDGVVQIKERQHFLLRQLVSGKKLLERAKAIGFRQSDDLCDDGASELARAFLHVWELAGL
jgi:hypothetical protein